MAAPLRIAIAPGTPSSRRRVQLSGRTYVLDLRWSQREERWYLDLRDSAGELLVGSIKVACNWPLLSYYHHLPGVPAGELQALDPRPSPADPGLDELGGIVALTYSEPTASTASSSTSSSGGSGGGGLPGGFGEL